MPVRSLIAKLVLFYVALSLLALLLVKSTMLLVEFREFRAGLERGRIEQAIAATALQLQPLWNGRVDAASPGIERELESLLLRLQQPQAGSADESAKVMLELARQPLAARVVDRHGLTLAQAPARSGWQTNALSGADPAWRLLKAREGAILLTSADSPLLLRRYAAPLRDLRGGLRGAVLLELRLPLPWRTLAPTSSLEWEILLAYLLVFSVGSGFFISRYVTARLNRIGAAASAWRSGDFTSAIEDHSRDELGRVAGELNRMALDLRALVQTRARLATLEERQRLARDLHDTIKQKAFALNLQLATAMRLLVDPTPPVAARLEEARRISEEIQSELAQILDELRVPESGLALEQQLQGKVRDFSRRSGLAIEARLAPAARIDPRHHDSVLRIIDEALANVLRHSGASKVVLELRDHGKEFELSVVDDGLGAAREREGGMGLRNMRERAAALPAGRFQLAGASGEGTRVTVCWSHPEGPVAP